MKKCFKDWSQSNQFLVIYLIWLQMNMFVFVYHDYQIIRTCFVLLNQSNVLVSLYVRVILGAKLDKTNW